jgi:very-short-patch-repair endonuclease
MKIPEIVKQAARDLRNNMTPSEVILWNYLKTDAL